MGHQGTGHPRRARLDADTARTVATTLQGLATPSRLLILQALDAGPRTVAELIEAVGMEQSAVSHQLRVLRDLGFVTGERRGRNIIYRLFDSHVTELMNQAIYHAEHVRTGTAENHEGRAASHIVPPDAIAGV